MRRWISITIQSNRASLWKLIVSHSMTAHTSYIAVLYRTDLHNWTEMRQANHLTDCYKLIMMCSFYALSLSVGSPLDWFRLLNLSSSMLALRVICSLPSFFFSLCVIFCSLSINLFVSVVFDLVWAWRERRRKKREEYGEKCQIGRIENRDDASQRLCKSNQ